MADTTPPDYATPIGQVRLLITDTAEPYVYSDDQIEAFLAMSGDSVNRAAAAAALNIAFNTVLLLKYVKTDDLLVDGPKVSAELRQLAERLIAAAENEELADAEFMYVTYPDDLDAWPELLPRPVFWWR